MGQKEEGKWKADLDCPSSFLPASFIFLDKVSELRSPAFFLIFVPASNLIKGRFGRLFAASAQWDLLCLSSHAQELTQQHGDEHGGQLNDPPLPEGRESCKKSMVLPFLSKVSLYNSNIYLGFILMGLISSYIEQFMGDYKPT